MFKTKKIFSRPEFYGNKALFPILVELSNFINDTDDSISHRKVNRLLIDFYKKIKSLNNIVEKNYFLKLLEQDFKTRIDITQLDAKIKSYLLNYIHAYTKNLAQKTRKTSNK